MTDSGDLRERVAWDRRVQVDDGEGNTEADFAEVFRCWGGFTPLRGGEAVLASRLEGRQPVVVRLRASSQSRSIASDWQMRDLRTGIAYAVRSVIHTPDRKWIDVTVESGVAA